MMKRVTGLDVYRQLMDLDLILQDSDKMILLHQFLCSVSDDSPALAKLSHEITVFTARIAGIVQVSMKKDPT